MFHLIVALIECCCRHKKPTAPTDSDASANAYSTSDFTTTNSTPVDQQSVPQINYDEIDPPPSYAALFPNQKTTTTNESNGINASTTEDDPPPATLPTN